jgi:hypothetical protein
MDLAVDVKFVDTVAMMNRLPVLDAAIGLERTLTPTAPGLTMWR